MITHQTTVPAVPLAAPEGRVVRFLGDNRTYWRLLIRGNALLMCTLGIYRFWLVTDIRRFLWSNTELAGESFEYTGTARELLLGFLIAMAILIPIYVVLFISTLDAGLIGAFSGVISFVLLAFLGHYAVYRARRYRLTRTIYRSVRFHQSGSAWRYAICAVFWWALIALSLGLAYPFAQSRLERFKMRHTFFGNLPGRFEASAWSLFIRGVLLWLFSVVPVTAGLVATVGALDLKSLGDLSRGGGDDILGWLERSGLVAATVIGTLTIIWAVLAVAIFYPIFQAIMWRWWTSGLRFGDVAVVSRLRTSQVYGVYARFLGFASLFTLLVVLVGGIGAYAFGQVVGEVKTQGGEILATVAIVVSYMVVMIGYSIIYQVTVRLGIWRSVAESLDLSGLAALEHVTAAGQASSPVGEGLADALNVGGI